jgi:hypothetical protein
VAGRLPLAWGATADDLARAYPADTMLDGPVVSMTRAVPVAAPPDVGWRWLCQIAVAPYSYDWVDNRGRRSPSDLTPGADDLRLGQLMTIFELTDVQPGRQWSGITVPRAARLFGDVAVTYAVEPVTDTACRMVCRFTVSERGLLQRLRVRALAWGDLVMMRRQLLNLKALAERDARAV